MLCRCQEAPIHKGSEGFTYNNTIKIVKLYKNIKVKIIIENIVFVVGCLHWLHLIVWGWRTPNGRTYGVIYCGFNPSTASGPPSLSGTASLGSPFKGSWQTEGLTEGSFCILHSAFKG